MELCWLFLSKISLSSYAISVETHARTCAVARQTSPLLKFQVHGYAVQEHDPERRR